MARHPKRSPLEAPEILIGALETIGGPALVLDAELQVVVATEGAKALVGTDLPVGVSAPRLLCGGAVSRPLAEGLARGVAVAASIMRPIPGGGERTLRVRATPILADEVRVGWVLLLDELRQEPTSDAPVEFHGLWTRDPALKRVFQIVERAARREVSVLIRGETGTGKELVARAVHACSPRRDGPFKAINCAALPPALLESELFGHQKGAFTGAVREHTGIFRAADRGTLFLDEVAELPLELQAKLLRVLETRTVLPVGSTDPIPVDVRIVAATHQGLRQAVEEHRFRADLMFRLRVVPIFLPSLRARPLDVALLTDLYVEELNRQGGREVRRVSAGVRAVFERYPWPGNVRELRNVLEYAYVVGDGPALLESELPPELSEGEGEAELPVNQSPTIGVSDEVAQIQRALERAGGSRERAAQILGLSRVTLWRRMKALGLQ